MNHKRYKYRHEARYIDKNAFEIDENNPESLSQNLVIIVIIVIIVITKLSE